MALSRLSSLFLSWASAFGLGLAVLAFLTDLLLVPVFLAAAFFLEGAFFLAVMELTGWERLLGLLLATAASGAAAAAGSSGLAVAADPGVSAGVYPSSSSDTKNVELPLEVPELLESGESEAECFSLESWPGESGGLTG